MKSELLRIKNIRLAYIIAAARNSWFVSSIWLFFWLKYMTYSEIGIIDAISILVAFMVEIPFGALADMIGRKKVLIFAFASMSSGALLMSGAQNTMMLAIGNVLFLGGFSANSGAYDALTYDTLVSEGKVKLYPKFYSTVSTLGWIVSAISLFIGGITFRINMRLPFFLWGAFSFIGFIATLFLTEAPLSKKITFKRYVRQNISGIKALFSKALRSYFPFILITLGFVYFYDWSFLRPAIGDANGLDGYTQSMLYAFTSIPAALVVMFIPRIKRSLSYKNGVILLSLILAILYLTFSFNLGYIISIPMLLFSSVSAVSFAWMTMIINEKVDTKYRATAVSGMYMILKIPYILLAIVGGKIIEAGNLSTLVIIITGVIVVSTFILVFGKVDRSQIL